MGLRTPLHGWHQHRGAKIVDFGGWDMPIVYSSITAEHQQTRKVAGLFDISHMGRVWFTGKDAQSFLDHILSNTVADMTPGQVRYALVLNDEGCVKDDVLVYRFTNRYLLVVNASNREKLLSWFDQHRANFDVQIDDETISLGMLAIQGPVAKTLVPGLFGGSAISLKNYQAMQSHFEGAPAFVSRTGYTGEDGFEIIVAADQLETVWSHLLDAAGPLGACPVGLGARDTLRLEAGMPLYGHELSEGIDPIQAKLAWAVKEKLKDFVGKKSLIERNPNRHVRVGLMLEDKRIPREGFSIFSADEKVGHVSSGTFGPTIERPIAMAYVKPDCSAVGQMLEIEIRQSRVPARVVPLPFYRRAAD